MKFELDATVDALKRTADLIVSKEAGVPYRRL
jgi:hypothetical protein